MMAPFSNADFRKRGIRMKKLGILLKEWFKALTIGIVIMVLLYFTMWPMRISGNSMEDSFMDGDYILVSRISKYLNNIDTNDVVVAYAGSSDEEEKVVKRIIATEGEHLQIKGGNVYINSKPVNENYNVKGITEGEVDLFIPRNMYYLLGDHRKISKDSRSFGCVPHKNVVGKVIIKLF